LAALAPTNASSEKTHKHKPGEKTKMKSDMTRAIDRQIREWGKTYCDNVRKCFAGDEGKFRQHVAEVIGQLPMIGCKACEERQFFLDGLPIKDATALHYWKNGGAIFLPFARQRMKEIDMQNKAQ
jgi:hypothetical protein